MTLGFCAVYVSMFSLLVSHYRTRLIIRLCFYEILYGVARWGTMVNPYSSKAFYNLCSLDFPNSVIFWIHSFLLCQHYHIVCPWAATWINLILTHSQRTRAIKTFQKMYKRTYNEAEGNFLLFVSNSSASTSDYSGKWYNNSPCWLCHFLKFN